MERRKKLVSEPNHNSCKHFSNNLMAIEMRKTRIYMDKPMAVGQAALNAVLNSKILMYKFYYDYLRLKYHDKIKICYMDTDSFILHIKLNDFIKTSAATLIGDLILQNIVKK